MTMMLLYVYLYIIEILSFVQSGTFYGGLLSWQALSPNVTNTSTITIQLHQTYSWASAAWPCAMSTGPSNTLTCLTGCVLTPTTISVTGACIDVDFILGRISCQSVQTLTYPIGSRLVLAYQNSSWVTLVSGIPSWSLTTYISLVVRNDSRKINSSPSGKMLPIVIVRVNVQQVLRIPMTDPDQDIITCRWANSSAIVVSQMVDECAGVCQNIPGSQLYSTSNLDNNCTIVFTTTAIGYYVVALQIEDFMPSQSNGTALSSVPLQFLVLSLNVLCALPTIIGKLNNGDTILVQANVTFSTDIIAQIGCNNTAINQFMTISLPAGVVSTTSIVTQSSGTYSTTLTWTPSFDQIGTKQLYCTIAVASDDSQSVEYCLNFVVVATTTTSTTATVASYANQLDLRLVIPLTLGLGIPLCLLLSLLVTCCCCPQWYRQSSLSKIRRKFWDEENTSCRVCESQRSYHALERNNAVQTNEHANNEHRIQYSRTERRTTSPNNMSSTLILNSQSDLNSVIKKRTSFLLPTTNQVVPVNYPSSIINYPSKETLFNRNTESHLFKLYSQQNNDTMP